MYLVQNSFKITRRRLFTVYELESYTVNTQVVVTRGYALLFFKKNL